jgi:hypothetical protein
MTAEIKTDPMDSYSQSVSPAKKVIFFAAVFFTTVFLLYYVDDNLATAWPTNVVRNWLQFGILNLHGQLASNPGGYDIAHPNVYKGMSPVCLYPAFLVSKIFQGSGLEMLPFQVLLVTAIFWASWHLLGRDRLAVILATTAILCPGYMRWMKFLDPNAVSVLPVIPYAAIVLAILKKPKLTPGMGALLVVLTLAFMSLNWTTAWVCAPCVFLLWGMPGANRRGIILVAVLMFIAVPAVVLLSLAAKTGGPASQSGHILGGYTWANGGYGEGLTTGRAFLRLAAVNGIGFLPLGLGLIYATVRRRNDGSRFPWFAFTPLALTAMDVIIMRNYFGHHPWMSGPVMLVGLIFSLALLQARSAETSENSAEKIPFKLMPLLMLLGFVYGLVVLMFFRANQMDMLSLLKLVRQHSPRGDTLVIVKSADAATASLADRLDEPLDRHIVVVDNFNGVANVQGSWMILSSVKLDDSFMLMAQSGAHSQSFLTRVADWFNHSIAKRSRGDRLELSGNYYLYGPRH